MTPGISEAQKRIEKIERILKGGYIPSTSMNETPSGGSYEKNRLFVDVLKAQKESYEIEENPLQKRPKGPKRPSYIKDPIEMPADTAVKKSIEKYKTVIEKQNAVIDVPLSRYTHKDEIETTPNVSKALLSLTPPPKILREMGVTKEQWSSLDEWKKVQIFKTYYEDSTGYKEYDPSGPPNSPERNAPQPPERVRRPWFNILDLYQPR